MDASPCHDIHFIYTAHVFTKAYHYSVPKDGESAMPWLAEYEHYWTRPEPVEGLDFTQEWTREGMLAAIGKLTEVKINIIMPYTGFGRLVRLITLVTVIGLITD